MTVDIDEGKTFRKIILYVSASTLARGDAHIPLLHPDDREESRKVWSTCLRTGEAGEVSFRVRDAQGGYRWFLSRAEPLRASDGTLLQWVGVNLDIEELMCAEQALRESEAKFRDYAESASDFGKSARTTNSPADRECFWFTPGRSTRHGVMESRSCEAAYARFVAAGKKLLSIT
jgi:PAS domain-containing protein